MRQGCVFNPMPRECRNVFIHRAIWLTSKRYISANIWLAAHIHTHTHTPRNHAEIKYGLCLSNDTVKPSDSEQLHEAQMNL